MPLSDSEKVTIVTNALKDAIPYTGSGSDTRSLANLKAAFLKAHLDSMVHSYQRKQADAALEDIATETVN